MKISASFDIKVAKLWRNLATLDRILKFFAIALLGVEAPIAVAAVLSSPAVGQSGGGCLGDEYPWDTDNLRYARDQYTVRSSNVPFHQYGGYSESAWQSSVVDAFFRLVVLTAR